MATSRPAFMFYPGDWLRNPGLRSCSLSSRGTWIDLMAFMHGSPRYGHLVAADGHALTDAQIARMVGVPVATWRRLLAELLAAGVGHRADDGTIYSPRMVEDERVRVARATGGSLGGNPALKSGAKGDRKVNLPPNLGEPDKDNQNPTPSIAVAVAGEPSTTTARDRLLEQQPGLAPVVVELVGEHGEGAVEQAAADLLANGEIADEQPVLARKFRNYVGLATRQRAEAAEHAPRSRRSSEAVRPHLPCFDGAGERNTREWEQQRSQSSHPAVDGSRARMGEVPHG